MSKAHSIMLQVRELRLVRREGGKTSLCSVLVRFDEQAAADDFYTNYNGKPVRVGHHPLSAVCLGLHRVRDKTLTKG